MKIVKYPDGSSYVKLDDFLTEPLSRTFLINSYEDLWHLNQYVDACNSQGFRPEILIPNLIDAQADRRFNKDESSGLKLICNFLNKLNADFTIFHPHNQEVVEAFMDNVTIKDNIEFIRSVLQYLVDSGNKNLEENTVIISPDAGAFKWVSKMADKIGWKGEVYSATKSRSWNEINGSKLVQEIDRQDFKGKNIIIVDDICIYGGTFKGLANILKNKNCGKLYLAVSHMTVQDLGLDPVTNYFNKVFTTNSKFDGYCSDGNYSRVPNLEIINLF